MKMNFSERLHLAAKDKSPICIGLDPRQALIPDACLADARALAATPDDDGLVIPMAFEIFCKHVIDLAAPHVAAIKPQAAFFEAFGSDGFRALESVCRYGRAKGLAVIADVKRGDIGSTAEAYARGFLRSRDHDCAMADSVTVNPYLGRDGVQPFIDAAKDEHGGIFVLVKTSNPSSGEVQDLHSQAKGIAIHDHVAALVTQWNQETGTIDSHGYGPVGAVVGATYPEHLAKLRELLPHSWLLVPGYGAQGGNADDIVHAFDQQGFGALISASRSLTFPWSKEDNIPNAWEDRVVTAITEMRDDLRRVSAGGNSA